MDSYFSDYLVIHRCRLHVCRHVCRSLITRLAVHSVRRRYRTRHSTARRPWTRFTSRPLRCVRHADHHRAAHSHQFSFGLRAAYCSRSLQHRAPHHSHDSRQQPQLRCTVPGSRLRRAHGRRVFRRLPQSRRQPASARFHPDSTPMTQSHANETPTCIATSLHLHGFWEAPEKRGRFWRVFTRVSDYGFVICTILVLKWSFSSLPMTSD